jgi:hypothetical protein
MTKPTTPAVANMADDLPLDTADLHITKPGTNIPTGWVITLAGPGHPQTIALSDEATRENLARSAAIERAQVNGRKWKGEEDQSPEAARRKTVTSVCKRIVSWTPVDFGEGPVPFSLENAVKLFMDPKKGSFYLQIVEFLTAERAFMRGSENS